MIRKAVLGAMVLMGTNVFVVRGQDDVVSSQLYGQGVHAYFAGDYVKAHESFTAAIDQGTQDPRCYYFRGLACSRLGRPEEAAADYSQGAQLETSNDERFYAVSQSLQRIQGYERLMLEDHRQAARVAARTRDVQRKRSRYEQLRRAEQEVLRDLNRPAPTDAPPLPNSAAADPTDPFSGKQEGLGTGAPVQQAAPKQPAESKAAEEDPFRALATPPAVKPAEPAKPAGAAQPAEADPFAAPSKPSAPPKPGEPPKASEPPKAAPSATNPFGAAPTAGAAPSAAAPASKSKDSGLFGSMGRAIGKAIGSTDAAPSKTAPADLPSAAPAQAAPAGKAPGPAEAAPAPGAAAANPFGDAKSATPPPIPPPPQPPAASDVPAPATAAPTPGPAEGNPFGSDAKPTASPAPEKPAASGTSVENPFK